MPAMVAILAADSAVTWLATRPEPPTPGLYSQFEIELPEDVDFSFTANRVVAVSRDGSRIVFIAGPLGLGPHHSELPGIRAPARSYQPGARSGCPWSRCRHTHHQPPGTGNSVVPAAHAHGISEVAATGSQSTRSTIWTGMIGV